MSKPIKPDPMTIPPTEAAIITASNMTELELVLPDMDDESLSDIATFLVACAMRFHSDPGFVQDQLDWLARIRQEEIDEGLKPDQLNSSNDD